MTGPIDTIREVLEGDGSTDEALAALTEVEQQLAHAEADARGWGVTLARAEAAERRANALQSDLVRMAEKKDKWQKHSHAAEQRANELADALRFYAQQRGLGARLASDGGNIARAALDRHTHQDEAVT